jgi:hypothetical protein
MSGQAISGMVQHGTLRSNKLNTVGDMKKMVERLAQAYGEDAAIGIQVQAGRIRRNRRVLPLTMTTIYKVISRSHQSARTIVIEAIEAD